MQDCDMKTVIDKIYDYYGDYDDADTMENNLKAMIKNTIKYILKDEKAMSLLELVTEEDAQKREDDAEERGEDKGIEYVLHNPSEYELFTEYDVSCERQDGYDEGVDEVVSNPGNHDLFSSEDIDEKISEAKAQWEEEFQRW